VIESQAIARNDDEAALLSNDEVIFESALSEEFNGLSVEMNKLLSKNEELENTVRELLAKLSSYESIKTENERYRKKSINDGLSVGRWANCEGVLY
jgi:hypothetical protein